MINIEIETEFIEEVYRFGDRSSHTREMQAGWTTHKIDISDLVFLRKRTAGDSNRGQFLRQIYMLIS